MCSQYRHKQERQTTRYDSCTHSSSRFKPFPPIHIDRVPSAHPSIHFYQTRPDRSTKETERERERSTQRTTQHKTNKSRNQISASKSRAVQVISMH
ncbi:hypothetical protein VTL71DRAFT_5365 [Oculimacula yallundae]|uniref:Uncharacterized protein n=1 Tax=Oculimacula yallundae TaxID=86028 RepID=A0ABR4C111_9HELO